MLRRLEKNHCSVRETDRLISQAICFFSNLSQKKLLKQSTLIKLIFGRGILAPYFMNTPVLFISPFSNFVQPPSPLPCHLQPPAPLLFLRLNWWLRHIWCAVLLNDIMDLHMSSLGTLVPEGPWCVFYATKRQVYWGLTQCDFLMVL